MPSDLESLQITAQELETLVDLDSSAALAIDLYRGFVLKNSKQMLSVLLTEGLLFILLLSFIMPVSLIMLRNAGGLPDNPASIAQLFIVMLGVSLLGILMLNVYLWRQMKRVKSLAKLMEKVDKHNSVIQAIAIIDKLESASQSPSQLSSFNTREEVIQALSITRKTITNALQVEKLMRKHYHFLSSHQELFANLEENFTLLMSLNLSDRVNEYSQLLNESLQIGLSVHQEVRKLRDLN